MREDVVKARGEELHVVGSNQHVSRTRSLTAALVIDPDAHEVYQP
jgi:hypothetical protein